MRTATYESVLHGVAATAGIDPANILAHEKTLLGEYINTAVKLCWDYYPWQEFTHTEKRYFRDEYDATSVYSQGDEVFHDGKYYKVWAGLAGNPAGAPDSDASTWYEVGDLSDSFVWSETGLYYVGARVSYQDKDYLCIAQPDGTTSSGVDPVNFEYDGILPTNGTYFQEIPAGFERYIGYEQTGKSVIGTVLSIHKTDPRYSTSPPVNFREGREGIYIDGHEVLNEVWLRYREEAPEFDPLATADSRIPKFLVPAIKCFAYKSWLIGDGQHEKSMVQEVMGYDLLVKELDRLDLQQERGQPYRITREPYRRINSQQPHVIERTKDQVAALKSAAVNTVIKVLTSGLAKNAVVTGAVIASASIGASCEATNAVKTAGSWVQGQEAVEGRYLIFPNGYEIPDGSGEYFPANTFFQITNVNTNGSPPYDINYTSSWVDSNGLTQTASQAIMDEAAHATRGTFWETYGRNDSNSISRISVTASGQDIVKEASVTCDILAFTGTPFRGIAIGFIGGEETTVHEVTVNPSVIDESIPLSDNSIWNVLEVGDRVGWKALNTSGANLYVNSSSGTQPVGAAILSNLLYPKNVGAVVNTYGGTGIVRVDFKYNGDTYGWVFSQAGYDNFYLVTADDTILLGCGVTAESEGQQKTTVNLSVGTYLYACKESVRSVGSMPLGITALAIGKNVAKSSTVSQIPIAIGFPLQPNGGDVIGENAVKSAFLWGEKVKYPIAVQGHYPLWETESDVQDYIDEFPLEVGWATLDAIQLNSIDYYYTSSLPLGGTQYFGNYTGTPDAHPAITVTPVTATESNTLSAFATLACSITTDATAQVATVEATVDTMVMAITASVNLIEPVEPLNVDFSDLTRVGHGMLYPLQTPTSGTGAGDEFYSFRDQGKLMWLDEDTQPAGTYRFRIRAYGVASAPTGAGIYNIQPYNTTMTTHLFLGFARDDGARITGQLYGGAGVADGVNYRSAVSQDGTATPSGGYYEIPSYTASWNNTNQYLGVPIDIESGSLPLHGFSNGQDGFTYNYSTGAASVPTYINNTANTREGQVFEVEFVTYEPLGFYLTIKNGSLVFRPSDISLEKIS